MNLHSKLKCKQRIIVSTRLGFHVQSFSFMKPFSHNRQTKLVSYETADDNKDCFIIYFSWAFNIPGYL